jgi:hypothetical protein
MAGLSKEERAQVKAAHDKAIQQNPVLDQKMQAAQQAMEEARRSMHDAMIKADPTVEPILVKMTPPKWVGKHEGAPGAPNSLAVGASPASTPAATKAAGWKPDAPHEHPGMATLTESERQQIKSLHEQLKNDPAVVAARQAKQAATTAEARNAAEEVLHQAMRDAMIKADPSVEPILAKLHPAGGQGVKTTPSPSAVPMVQ